MTRWIDPQPVQIPDSLRAAVATDCLLPDSPLAALLAELLLRRGIADEKAARSFLDPSAYNPTPPDELPDLSLTLQRIKQAIAEGEPIVVWGDFDVDGQTATALYMQALRSLGADVTFHIPSRRESHGVHPVGMQRLIDQGLRLLITADTGVDAHQAITLAAQHDIDVLVTDHHDLPSNLPGALALVNPKRLSADHPFYDLPGVGVAYQVMRALYQQAGRSADHLLDLVALGIVADVATLRGDVRHLLQHGLNVLRRTDRVGLKALLALADLNPALVNEEDIGFTIAPRLNALSRVGEELGANAGVELLITDDSIRARTIATALEALNAQRKWLVRETTDAALAQIGQDRALFDGPAIVIAAANWEPGIVGIVAGRLAEQFNRPAIVFSAPPGDMARGSARSVEGIDIHAVIAAQKDMLYRCGGHPMAAGVSLPGERIPEFRRALWRTMEAWGVAPAEKQTCIDAYLALNQISLDLPVAINRLAPFGPGNERPVFATAGLTVASSVLIGRTQEHHRILVRDSQGCEQTVFWWHSANQSPPDGLFDLAYTVSINTFRGKQSAQLTWLDARAVVHPAAHELQPETTVQVIDQRNVANPAAALHALAADDTQLIVWGEGVSMPDIPLLNRTALHPSPTLVIWTPPPSPDILHHALKETFPQRVVVFNINPGMDTPRAFLERLGGLIKYALQKHGGQTDLSALAAGTAQTEQAVRLGLEWMAGKGQIAFTLHEHGAVSLSSGNGQAGSLETTQRQIQALLQEAAAYRNYFGSADIQHIVTQSRG